MHDDNHSNLGNRMIEADQESLPSTVVLGTLQKQPTSSSGQLGFLDNELHISKAEQRKRQMGISDEAQRFASEYKLKLAGPGNPQDELSNQFESEESKNDQLNKSKNSSHIGEGLVPQGKASLPNSVTNKKPPQRIHLNQRTASNEAFESINYQRLPPNFDPSDAGTETLSQSNGKFGQLGFDRRDKKKAHSNSSATEILR